MLSTVDVFASAALPALAVLTIKASVLVVLALIAIRFLPALSAAARFAIVFYALTATLFVPLISSTLPPWQVLPNITVRTPISVSPSAPSTSQSTRPLSATQRQAIDTQRATPGVSAPTQSVLPSLAFWLIALWLSGIVALGLRTMLASFRLARLRRQAVPLRDASWRRRHDLARDQIGVTRDIELRLHPDPIMPMTFGHRAPVILLPLDAMEWDESRCRDVLLHELAHIKRHDLVYEWVSTAVCVVQWFNPLVWWAKRALMSQRERACDDLVLGAGTDPAGYANCLLETTVAYRAAALPGACIARPSELESRLLAIHDLDQSRQPLSRIALIGMAVLGASALLPLSTMALDERSPVATKPVADVAPVSVVETPEKPAKPSAPVQPVRDVAAPEPVRDPQARADALFSEYDSDSQLFREQATIDLKATGDEARADLLAALNSDFPVDRAAAAQRLADFDDPVVVQALIQSMNDTDAHVREWAARSLGEIGASEALTALSNALADPQRDVVEWSVRALGEINSGAGVDALVQALVHNDAQVREWSVRALGDIGSPRALDGLIASLQDSNSVVRQWAVRSLITLGEPRGIAAVASLENDPDEEVREWSQRAEELVEWQSSRRESDD